MSSTVVRPAARVNISLIFFQKIEKATLVYMGSFKIEYDRFHTLSIQEGCKRFFDVLKNLSLLLLVTLVSMGSKKYGSLKNDE